MTLSYTDRFKLAIPDFLSEPWHAEFAQAMQSIDDALYGAILGAGGTLWTIETAYEIGDIVIDPDSGGLYSASVTHTSGSGTFADDIANWTAFALTAATQAEAEAGTDNTAYMTALRTAQAIDAQSPTPGVATQEQAEVGTNNTEMMTPLRTVNQIDARLATQLQAEAGTDEEALMTPLRTAQFLDAAGLVGGTQIGFHAHKNGVNQTAIPSGVYTKVTCDTEFYDLGSYYDTANSRWTPPSGLVHIDAAIYLTAATAASFLSLSIYKNGVVFRTGLVLLGSTQDGGTISVDDSANGTDYYELYVSAGTGGAGIVQGATNFTYFLGHFLGETGTVTLGHEELGFHAHKNAVSQTSITSGVFTKITFGTESYDQGGFYDTANSRWTPSTGMIHIDAQVFGSSGSVGNYATLAVYKNGVAFKTFFELTNGAGTFDLLVSLDDVASGTDYYEVYGHSLGSWTANGTATTTYFSGHRVGGPQGEQGDTGPSGPTGTVTGAFGPPQGRLTLTTLTPVMTSTVSGATTLRYTPYVGDQVPIYDGVDWSMASIGTELSRTTADAIKSPAAIGASKCNDWFVWDDAGTITLSHGPDWTSDIARGTGAGTTELERIRGIWTNAFDITNGPDANLGTYVGTTRSNASSTLTCQFGSRASGTQEAWIGIWNCYNRVNLVTTVQDSTNSWPVSNITPPVALNSSTQNRISIVCGQPEDGFAIRFAALLANVTANYTYLPLGYDSITTHVHAWGSTPAVLPAGWVGTLVPTFIAAPTGGNGLPSTATLDGSAMALGFHFFQALQLMSGAGENGTAYGSYMQLSINWRY